VDLELVLQMSDRGYDVVSALVCDDIREERSGKEILIGVYNSAIIFNQFPARWPRLTFRVGLKLRRADFKRVRAKIIDKHGKQLFSMDQPVEPPPPALINSDDEAIIAFTVNNLTFPEPSRYTVSLAFDSEPEPVFHFQVRGPASDEEARRTGL
jgi:hypothetical protein